MPVSMFSDGLRWPLWKGQCTGREPLLYMERLILRKTNGCVNSQFKFKPHFQSSRLWIVRFWLEFLMIAPPPLLKQNFLALFHSWDWFFFYPSLSIATSLHFLLWILKVKFFIVCAKLYSRTGPKLWHWNQSEAERYSGNICFRTEKNNFSSRVLSDCWGMT